MLTPFKVYFQRLCEANVTWDQPLQGELLKEWNELISGLSSDGTIHIPRCYQNLNGTYSADKEVQGQLYGFCDASLKAYAAVVYVVTGEGEERVSRLVCAKTRVAPLKQLTIPRLELLSGLLLARLMIHTVSSSLETELQLLSPRCFTDSKVSYHWIRGRNNSWKPFVQNRVNEIKKLVAAEQWFQSHCPGRDNPADLPSRGIPLTELINHRLWFEGPTWITNQDPTELSSEEEEVPQECFQERKSHSDCTPVLVATEGRKYLVKLENYSNLNRLLQVSAYALLFIQKARKQEADLVDLIAKEEEWLAKEAQCYLRSGGKFEVLRRQLDLFQDSYGLWCRIHNANLPYSTRFPIVLPNHHHFTRLVINRAHERVFHNGVKETLVEVRSRYWVTKGRSVVKSMVRECVVCRRLEAVAYRTPPAPPLPDFRIQEAPAFTFVGVDFAGPLYLKQPMNVASESNKVWICLYTCCVTRGVHLNLVTDLSTASFLKGLWPDEGSRPRLYQTTARPLRLPLKSSQTKSWRKFVHT